MSVLPTKHHKENKVKLHSDTLNRNDIVKALEVARSKGLIVGNTEVLVLEAAGSNTRAAAFEVRLGVDLNKPDGIHRKRNMNASAYAATYEEWGWFILELFAIDEEMVFGKYKDLDSFHEQTRYAFT